MKLHYMGKYNLDPQLLPDNGHEPGAVAFREVKDSKTLGVLANSIALVLLVLLMIGLHLRWGFAAMDGYLLGALLSLLTMFPHEFLHAVCFREDVYLYTNLKQGMLFVVGPERMSKARFIFMSLLPNLVFGFVPYIFGLLFPLPVLGALGACAIAMGSGDYYNVFNAATQMPKGARTYLYKFNSYWYMPKKSE